MTYIQSSLRNDDNGNDNNDATDGGHLICKTAEREHLGLTLVVITNLAEGAHINYLGAYTSVPSPNQRSLGTIHLGRPAKIGIFRPPPSPVCPGLTIEFLVK